MPTKRQLTELRNRDYVRRVKELGSCSCGESRTVCLDFHHRDPSTKSFEISRMKAYSLQRMAEEIAKCDLLCANCHRVVHEELGMTEAVKREEDLPLFNI